MRGRLSRLARSIPAAIWERNASAERWPVRTGLAALRMLIVVARASQDAALNLRAMGLVYSTLLSIVPLLAVSFSVLKAFGAHYRIEPVLLSALEPLGPRGAEITRRVVEFVNNTQVGVLGAVGLAGLLYTVLSLVERIEESLNHVWQVRRPRTLARKFSDYLSILLVGPVLVVAALAVIAAAQSHWLVQRLIAITPLETLILFFVTSIVPFLFLCVAFSFMYGVMPNTRVRPEAALVGGAVAALLWQLAGTAFAAFVAGSTRYTAIYSGFAALVVFLIWLYVAWLIVLIGGQVAYFHQHPTSYLAVRTPPGVALREGIALGALVEVARRALAGEAPARLEDLATGIGAPVAVLDDLVGDLVAHGVLLRAAEPEGIALARPPDRVTAAEALAIVRDPQPAADRHPLAVDDAVLELLAARDRATQTVLGEVTLAALASRPATAPSILTPLTRARR